MAASTLSFVRALFHFPVLYLNYAQTESRKPHILLVVADDLGFHDVGYHGSEIKTPTIDQLASTGIKLENYYVQPICTPSRSQIMSGLYQIHTGLQHGIIEDGEPIGLPIKLPTLAQKLKDSGYATHIIGKWHLGYFKSDYLPTNRGFDTFYGYLGGNEDYYTHTRCGVTCGVDFYSDFAPVRDADGLYSTALFAKKAAGLIRAHNRSQPMFMYLAFQCPHGPLQVPKEYEKKYRFIKNKKRRTYAGMVSAMDQALASVTSALKAAGMWEDTLIVFTTDNGADPAVGGSNWPLRGGKGSYYEGGIRGVGFVAGPIISPFRRGSVVGDMVHVSDWYPTLVNVGGGSLNGSKFDGIDQWATLNLGTPSPRREILHNIDELFPIDGQPLYNDTFNSALRAALRVGDWKIMTGFTGSQAGEIGCSNTSASCGSTRKNVYLYNVTGDPSETLDMADSEPTIVRKMLARLAEYQATAVPAANPSRDPRSDPQFHGGVWGPWL